MAYRWTYTDDDQITANDSQTAVATGSLRSLLFGITNRIKAITGETSWLTAPQRSLKNTASSSDVFVGEMKTYAGTTAPNSNWMLCDGRAISRTTYASLFNAIGTNFGTGDGSTTFNIPDMRGRVPVGAGAGTGLTDRILGNRHGNETVQLTASQMPSHAHSGTINGNGAHHHNVYARRTASYNSGGTFFGVFAIDNIDLATSNSTINNTSSYGDHSHSISIANTGSDIAHPNIQPSINVSFVIKVQ